MYQDTDQNADCQVEECKNNDLPNKLNTIIRRFDNVSKALSEIEGALFAPTPMPASGKDSAIAKASPGLFNQSNDKIEQINVLMTSVENRLDGIATGIDS